MNTSVACVAFLTLDNLQPYMLNNTKFSQYDFLFFNRVPKVGSEQLIELIHRLSEINNFETDRALFAEPIYNRLSDYRQEALASEINDMGESSAYSMHVNYINFRQFDLPQPIYINMVRDPVERVISWFYYRRTPWTVVDMYKISNKFHESKWYQKNFEDCVLSNDKECQYVPESGFKNQIVDHKRQSLFFCGHDVVCEPFNSIGALQLAKQNVERDYAVVGSWEDVNITLNVLENYIPRFFKNATKIYFDGEDALAKEPQNTNPWKPKISEKIKNIIRQNFTNEYEFYYFCKQRLYKQYLALQNV